MGELKIEYSNKKVTPFGGMKLLKDFMDKIKILEDLKQVDIPYPRSNAGINPIDIIQGFWLAIYTGASRYIHADWLRYDSVLQEIFQIKRLPSQSTYSRFFHKFSWKRNSEVFPKLQQMFFNRVNIDNITLDLDSTVITRYGNQEGAKKGYNHKKPGRNSHHPLIAFIDQTKMIANAWLRSGDSADINNIENFLDETLNIALKNKKIGLVRADSGFYSNRFLEYLEAKKLNYIVAVKFYQNIQREIGIIEDWIEITKGLEVANFYFKPDSCDKTRRYIIVRKKIENYPSSGGKLLFDIPTYRYNAYVTNIDLPVDQIYNIYNTRADAENRIKELKYDFGIDNFCLKEFYATEASFRFIMIAYNILALFKHMIINSNMQLKTLKAYCFALGSWITNHSRNKVLKISLPNKKRTWMDGLFENIKNSELPYKYPS
jgi:hypothetical protein